MKCNGCCQFTVLLDIWSDRLLHRLRKSNSQKQVLQSRHCWSLNSIPSTAKFLTCTILCTSCQHWASRAVFAHWLRKWQPTLLIQTYKPRILRGLFCSCCLSEIRPKGYGYNTSQLTVHHWNFPHNFSSSAVSWHWGSTFMSWLWKFTYATNYA